MIWTLLSFGIIMILVLGMILAARLGAKPLDGAEPLGNCRRGAIRPAWKLTPVRGAVLLPKGPR